MYLVLLTSFLLCTLGLNLHFSMVVAVFNSINLLASSCGTSEVNLMEGSSYGDSNVHCLLRQY